MKYAKFFLTAFALLLAVSSCQENEPDATTKTIISFEVLDAPAEGARIAQGDLPPCNLDQPIDVVLIRYTRPDGSVFEGTLKPVMVPATGHYQLEIPDTEPGTYCIEEFLVLGPDGSVVYAVPHFDSPCHRKFARYASRKSGFDFWSMRSQYS